MDLPTVRDAYARRSQEYIDLLGSEDALHPVDVALVGSHLGSCRTVLDLGCGPGQWSAHLHRLGAQVTGVDAVPAFVAHARAHHPGPRFRLGSVQDVPAQLPPADGVLSWYATLHVAPDELDPVLAVLRACLVPGGVLVLGFFGSDDAVAPFDHAVVTAYRWPVAVMVERLERAGFAELERVQRAVAGRPNRRYAAVVARAV